MPDGPAPEVREPMIPSKGYTLAGPADWRVSGVASCPEDCTVALDCRLDELVKLTALHTCGEPGYLVPRRGLARHAGHASRWCGVGLCVNGSNLHPPMATCRSLGVDGD